MPRFSARSVENLATCREALQRVAYAAIADSPHDFIVICGHRGEEAQELAFAHGTSRVRFPDSRHNSLPSEAFDFAPCAIIDGRLTIDWHDWVAFDEVAKHIVATALRLGIEVESGALWSKFVDRPHIQLRRAA